MFVLVKTGAWLVLVLDETVQNYLADFVMLRAKAILVGRSLHWVYLYDSETDR